MKILKLTYALLAMAALSLTSCVKNEQPSFDDSNAFVAIQQSTASIAENSEDTLKIPVMLTSLSGIEGSVDFTIVADSAAAAVEGTHYTLLNSAKTLTFSKESPVQYIMIKPIDNDTFGGDVKMTITLTNPQGAILGANKTCLVTIGDDEHPLSFILGTFHCVGESGFGGDLDWELTIEKDANDLNKVWISNLVPGGSSLSVYAVVNEDKTTLSIPVGQDIHSTSSYDCKIRAFYGYNGEEEIAAGGSVTGTIDENGTITIADDYGTYAYNKGTTTGAGWYEYVMGGSIWTKQ